MAMATASEPKTNIRYFPEFTQITGSVKAGLLLSQAWYWKDRTNRPDKRFYKNTQEWCEELAFTEDEVIGAIKKCKGAKVLEVDRKGRVPATRHFKVNEKMVIDLLLSVCGKSANWIAENAQTRLSKNSKIDKGKSVNINRNQRPQQKPYTETAAGAATNERVLSFFEQEIGTITPTLEQKILLAKETYTEEWLIDAIEETTLSGGHSWKYVESILERWKRDGRNETIKTSHKSNKQFDKEKLISEVLGLQE
jgi:DnaD/phage-associated family protein